MLLTKTVFVRSNPNNFEHYASLGYDFKYGETYEVPIEHLPKTSRVDIEYECDKCHKIISTKFGYLTRHRDSAFGKLYCKQCSNNKVSEPLQGNVSDYLAKNGIKKCRKCNNKYPANLDYFFAKPNTKDNFTTRCKECMGKSFTNHLTHIPKEGYMYCKKCDRELPYTKKYFPTDKTTTTGLRFICRECNPKYKNFLTDDYVANEKWTPTDIELLKSIYADYTNEEIVEQFFPNRTKKSLASMADVYGFTGKSEEATLRARKEGDKIRSEKSKGRMVSAETRMKTSVGLKKYYETHDSIWKGVKKSPEQIEALRQRDIEQGKWKGELNPRVKNPLPGELNPRWLGGVTDIYRELRSDTKGWMKDSMCICNYKCVITGKAYDDIHHLTPFRTIVNDALYICDLDERQLVKDYEKNEISDLKDILILLHDEYGFGACLNKEVHRLFHKEYGYYNTTVYDFADFLFSIKNGKYNKWFEENNFEININEDYFTYVKSLCNYKLKEAV